MDVYMEFNQYLFKDVIITPHMYVFQHNTVPSILGGHNLNNNFLGYYRAGCITSRRIAARSYSKVIDFPCIIVTNFDYHYGHFLLESLSRLYLIRSLPKDLPLVFVSCVKHNVVLQKHEHELLELYGITNPIYFLNQPALFKSAWIAPAGCAIDGYIIPEQVQALGVVPSKPIAGKRIYISRSKIENGKCVNEEELEGFLADRGWEIFHPEDLSVKRQAEIIASAEIVFTIAGSALHSLLLLDAVKQRIVVVPRIHSAIYNIIAKYKTLDYWLLGVTRRVLSSGWTSTKDIWELDLKKLTRMIAMSDDFSDLSVIRDRISAPLPPPP